MDDVLGGEVGGGEVRDVAGLAAVRAEVKDVAAGEEAEVVERLDVGVEVVEVVGVGRLLGAGPLRGRRERGERARAGGALGRVLVADAVEAADVAEERVERGVRGRVLVTSKSGRKMCARKSPNERTAPAACCAG